MELEKSASMSSDYKTKLQYRRDYGESESCSVMSDSAIPWTIESMEFSRPEFWSG